MKTIVLEDLWKKGFKIVHSDEFLFSIQNTNNPKCSNPVIVEVLIEPENNIKEEDLTIKNILGALTNEIQVGIEDLEEKLKNLLDSNVSSESIIDKQQFQYDINRCETKLALLKSLLHEKD